MNDGLHIYFTDTFRDFPKRILSVPSTPKLVYKAFERAVAESSTSPYRTLTL